MVRIENPHLEHAALMRCIAKHPTTTSPGMTAGALLLGAQIIERLVDEIIERKESAHVL